MNNQPVAQLKKEIEMYELAVMYLKEEAVFHEAFQGTSIPYEPIKLLENTLATLHYRLEQEEKRESN